MIAFVVRSCRRIERLIRRVVGNKMIRTCLERDGERTKISYSLSLLAKGMQAKLSYKMSAPISI
jgi:hypothetical protein